MCFPTKQEKVNTLPISPYSLHHIANASCKPYNTHHISNWFKFSELKRLD
ncbi:hypothetical protein Hanom_Chr06g00527431 [Helianthus anomalus]